MKRTKRLTKKAARSSRKRQLMKRASFHYQRMLSVMERKVYGIF